jgi:uncharacterized protein (DUF302 family)
MKHTVIRKIILLTALIFASPALVLAGSGMMSVKSHFDVKTTTDRLENILKEKGMTVFSRINHAAGAKKVEQALRPTELLIFGNPKLGSKLMQCQQTMGIDLPQKALVWQDENKQVWLTYNDPDYLLKRHTAKQCGEINKKISKALNHFAQSAAGQMKKP